MVLTRPAYTISTTLLTTRSFYESHDGRLLCGEHFYQAKGAVCTTCAKTIAGKVVTAMNRKYHPECFVRNSSRMCPLCVCVCCPTHTQPVLRQMPPRPQRRFPDRRGRACVRRVRFGTLIM